MNKSPVRPKWYLKPLTWLLSFPEAWAHRTKINKAGIKNIKPPYILLSNHNAFFDFKEATLALFPRAANYVVAIDGFIDREGLLRNVGCICKRKFTSDITLVRHIREVLKAYKGILAMYPEARYSLCGTNSELPDSLGKLVKLMEVPLLMLKTYGNHINSPFWNTKNRKVKGLCADMFQIAPAKEIKNLSAEEINYRINKAFEYDDFAWQRDNKVKVAKKDRAKGLHKVLYQCPACGKEFMMSSSGSVLKCGSCGKEWEMSVYGELKAKNGVTEFSHIPDWYEWERKNVRKEIENNTYGIKCAARVESLPNSKGFINLGKAEFIHNMDGFSLEGFYNNKRYGIIKPAASAYSVHIEYDYMERGDCLDLSEIDKTYYIFLDNNNSSVTKISLAAEEMYKYYNTKKL